MSGGVVAPKDRKVHKQNGSTMKWALGAILLIALAAAGFANGAVWAMSHDIKDNAVTSAQNAAKVDGMERVMNQYFMALERRLARIEDKLDK